MVNPSSPSTDAIETALRKIDSRVFTPRVRLTFVLGWGIFIVVIIARPFVLLQGHWQGSFRGKMMPKAGTRAGEYPAGSRGRTIAGRCFFGTCCRSTARSLTCVTKMLE